ncbi:nucleotidyl transferase AbiEii/AbiGii toxin family protein [Actinoplanes sp. NPDC049599]|uniref:nucleotidyl transferase AbiEii/AbiGii toxin family protein n=1 Tax=Actinoplanes sp. NPDC049599 TaxID=3363903 RepID=UPI00379CFC69
MLLAAWAARRATVDADLLVRSLNLDEASVLLGAGNSRVRDYADIWTLTRSHDITAADLLTALAATSAHREVTLRPLAEVIGDFGVVRAGAHTAYRRRLGPDAAKLPEGFAQVVDDVITFADPALASAVASRAIWTALSARWNE